MKFIGYALFVNPSIGLYAIEKLSKKPNSFNEESENKTSFENQSKSNPSQNLREFCGLIDLKYRDDLKKSEIDTAYRKACKKYHPDKTNNSEFHKKFNKIQECKSNLLYR